MRTIRKGATSQSLYFEVLDSASTSGGRKTGLAYNTSSLTAYYVRNGGSATAITLATLAAANSAWSSGGFKEVDATNMPGIYRLDVPDAAFASGADSVAVTIRGATGMVQATYDVQLVAVDPQDAVRGGLTALPNANAEAAGGLFTRGTGAGQINQDANGRIDVSLKAILGTTLTETAGQIAAAFKKLFDVASPVLTATSVNQTGDNYARLGAPAGASVSADIAAAFTNMQSHGDSYWLTATGFSTSADITAAVSTLEGYGDTNWATATGFSTLGSSDVSDAVWDVQLTDHVDSGSMGQSLFYAQQGATSADSKANDIYGDTQAIRGVTDGLVQTGGKLWVLDDQGNPLRHSDEIASDFSTLSTHGDGAWATANVSDLPTNAELATAIAGIPAAPTVEAIADEVATRTLDANIKKVNDVTVTGNGTTGNEWGPA